MCNIQAAETRVSEGLTEMRCVSDETKRRGLGLIWAYGWLIVMRHGIVKFSWAGERWDGR